jgi:hypothetical protein
LVDDTPAVRAAAHGVEAVVCSRLAEFLSDLHAVEELVGGHGAEVGQICQSFEAAGAMSAKLRATHSSECFDAIRQLLRKVIIGDAQISIEVDQMTLVMMLEGKVSDAPPHVEVICLEAEAVRLRPGRGPTVTIPSAGQSKDRPAHRNEKLTQLMAEAHAARQLIEHSPDKALSQIAAEQGRCRTHLRALIAVSCLAPEIITAIVEGRHPASLTRRKLMSGSLPFDWEEQRAILRLEP